ncbi:DUF2285 domain-containing protein [Labrys okinawensis]|uniref:DUF2285 domain-containing protein n=1 Tax=Labrys okinawensis TaxID=346911 RepID=UPI0039BD3FFC
MEDTSSVLLTALPDLPIADDDIRACMNKVGFHADELGAHALCNLDERQRLQLLYVGDAERGGPIAAIVPLGLEGFDRLEAIFRLLAALHQRPVPQDRRLTPQQRSRARRMLQAWDGDRNGATQRELAEVVFHHVPRGRDEWQASSSRYAVMALLRDARRMIAGGYRTLLHHRRRS